MKHYYIVFLSLKKASSKGASEALYECYNNNNNNNNNNSNNNNNNYCNLLVHAKGLIACCHLVL